MNNETFHLDISTATDFARDLTPQGERWAIERHLRGCSECTHLVEVFKKLYSVAQLMDEAPVPDSWVKAADDVFISKMVGSEPSFPARIAELIFDSFYQPRPAEVRAELSGRVVSYSCGDCSIDLQIDLSADSDAVLLIGQVVVEESLTSEIAGKPIVLLHKGRLLARTAMTEFGEFRMKFRRRGDVRLAFSVGPQQVEVPLDLIFRAE